MGGGGNAHCLSFSQRKENPKKGMIVCGKKKKKSEKPTITL